jgi:transcription elongation factor Elf1
MPSNSSKDDVQMVSFRCPSCGEHTLRPLDWSVKHSSVPCSCCAGLIELDTPENRDRIKRAAAQAKD